MTPPRPLTEGRRQRQLRNLGFTDPDGELTERGERYAEDLLEDDRLEDEDDREPEPYPDSNLY